MSLSITCTVIPIEICDKTDKTSHSDKPISYEELQKWTLYFNGGDISLCAQFAFHLSIKHISLDHKTVVSLKHIQYCILLDIYCGLILIYSFGSANRRVLYIFPYVQAFLSPFKPFQPCSFDAFFSPENTPIPFSIPARSLLYCAGSSYHEENAQLHANWKMCCIYI